MTDPATPAASDVSALPIADLQKMLSGDSAEVTLTKEAVEKEETPAAAAEKAEAKPAEESGTPETKEPAEAVSANVQKRIDKAVKAQREAERKAADLEQRLQAQDSTPAKKEVAATQPAETGKPQIEKFQTYEEYTEALTDWKLDQREAKRAQADAAKVQQTAFDAKVSAYKDRETALRAKHADYDEKIDGVVIPDTPARAKFHETLLESEAGPDLAYFLASNPEEIKRIASLSPNRAVVELGKLEASLSEAEAAPKSAEPLPKPPATVGGKSSPSTPNLNDPNLSMEAFTKLARAQLKRATF